jgi:large subunit ribosomal protein L18
MGSANIKNEARLKRKVRIRKKLVGTKDRPRLCVFRSSKHIYAQAIDDTSGRTLATASSSEKAVKGQLAETAKKKTVAGMVGKVLAERIIEKGYRKVVFDRNGFLYHGRVKAVSDGAREAGLDF